MKVLIWGNRLFSVDMMWGFAALGHETNIIAASGAEEMRMVLTHEKPDLLITLGAPTELAPNALKALGERGRSSMRYIHWDTDGISSTYFSSASGEGIEMDVISLSKPDLVLTMCPEMHDFIVKRNFPCEMMHYAYSPLSHRPMQGLDNDQFYINLIGNSYSTIIKAHPDHFRLKSINVLIKPLLENGYQIHYYGDTGYRQLLMQLMGKDVPNMVYHYYLPYEKTCAAYNSAFINLVTQNHEHTITKRTFEILGSGGFALSMDNHAIRELFVPGRDIAVSSSPEQTLELVEYYKTNMDKWREVRNNAVLSVKEHTYQQRAGYILDLLKKYPA